MKFHQETLANGLEIVCETNENVHSVAIAFLVRTGARDETAEVMGVSHFLEHMAFKGTEERSADDVNRILDEIGSASNASTGNEITQYYAVMLPEYFKTALEVLAGIVRPSLREDDFEMERNVILEEIGMYADQPMWVAYEEAMEAHFGPHPLGYRILGTNDTISEMTVDQMREYHGRRYAANNITLAVTGNVNWSQVLEATKRFCGEWPTDSTSLVRQAPTPHAAKIVTTRPQALVQHVMQLAPAPGVDHPMKETAELLSIIVGDDSGSRLFWELLDPGLAEAADLSFSDYEGYGLYMTYLCSRADDTLANLERIRQLYDSLNREGVTEEETQQAKNKCASRLVLQSERPLGRLRSVAGTWMALGEYHSLEEDLRRLENIGVADIRELLDAFPLGQMTTATYGSLTELPFEASR